MNVVGPQMKTPGAPAEPGRGGPAQSDKRFSTDWHEHFPVHYIKQSYLIAARWMHDSVSRSVEGLDEHEEEGRLHAAVHDALAPSNFALTTKRR